MAKTNLKSNMVRSMDLTSAESLPIPVGNGPDNIETEIKKRAEAIVSYKKRFIKWASDILSGGGDKDKAMPLNKLDGTPLVRIINMENYDESTRERKTADKNKSVKSLSSDLRDHAARMTLIQMAIESTCKGAPSISQIECRELMVQIGILLKFGYINSEVIHAAYNAYFAYGRILKARYSRQISFYNDSNTQSGDEQQKLDRDQSMTSANLHKLNALLGDIRQPFVQKLLEKQNITVSEEIMGQLINGMKTFKTEEGAEVTLDKLSTSMYNYLMALQYIRWYHFILHEILFYLVSINKSSPWPYYVKAQLFFRAAQQDLHLQLIKRAENNFKESITCYGHVLQKTPLTTVKGTSRAKEGFRGPILAAANAYLFGVERFGIALKTMPPSVVAEYYKQISKCLALIDDKPNAAITQIRAKLHKYKERLGDPRSRKQQNPAPTLPKR